MHVAGSLLLLLLRFVQILENTPLPVQDLLGNTELNQYRLLEHKPLGSLDVAFLVECCRFNTWLKTLRCVAAVLCVSCC